MTKTLTEQWREGKLPEGWYYVKTPCEKIKKLYCGDGESLELEDPETAGYYFFHRDLNKGPVEALSPVPDYKMFQFLMGEQKFTEEMLENIINIRTEELLKLNGDYIKRVKKLEKKLEIATKALKRIDPPNIIFDDYKNRSIELWEIAHNALKEMAGVK